MSAQAEDSDDSRVQRLRDILASGAVREASRLLRTLAPAEIAHLLESIPPAEREIVWNLVDEEYDGQILLLVTDEVRAQLIRHMDEEALLAATENLDLDDLADLVQQMPSAITSEVLQSLDDQRRKRLETVLSFSEDTAGGLMNTDTVTVRPEVTLDVVLRYLRRLGDAVPVSTDKLFVVNRDDGYLGILRLSSLVTRDPEDTVAEAMSLAMQPIHADMSASDVARRFEAHDMLSAPVVDEDGRLLGRITVDDVIDVIREEGEHQFMGGAGLSEEEDMFAPVLSSTRPSGARSRKRAKDSSRAGTKASVVPVNAPTIARPVTCCHQLSVCRSYITRSELRSLPVVPKSSTRSPTRRSNTTAALHSGQ